MESEINYRGNEQTCKHTKDYGHQFLIVSEEVYKYGYTEGRLVSVGWIELGVIGVNF